MDQLLRLNEDLMYRHQRDLAEGYELYLSYRQEVINEASPDINVLNIV
jgi:hypothetical protein